MFSDFKRGETCDQSLQVTDNRDMETVHFSHPPRALRRLMPAAFLGLALVVSLAAMPAEAAKAKAAVKKPAAKTLASCAWDRPNANPYMGELPAALDRYTDIPLDVRNRLKERVAMQQYDDMVEIKRDAIIGKGRYSTVIRDMHFGPVGTVCKTVTRKKWKDSTTERGLVYCEGAHCVLVPTVCRNVSRINRTGEPPSTVNNANTSTPPTTTSSNQTGSGTGGSTTKPEVVDPRATRRSELCRRGPRTRLHLPHRPLGQHHHRGRRPAAPQPIHRAVARHPSGRGTFLRRWHDHSSGWGHHAPGHGCGWRGDHAGARAWHLGLDVRWLAGHWLHGTTPRTQRLSLSPPSVAQRV